MSHRKDFIRELDRLYAKRTAWLRSVIGIKKPGPTPKLSRKLVDRGNAKLQGIASEAFANQLAKDEFVLYAPAKRSWQVRGHGPKAKRKRFDRWFTRHFDSGKNCVYVFWGKRGGCVYIGRTGSGGNRPRNHFEKYWFGSVRRIDIYPVQQASQLPKLECLAIHRYQPSRNIVRAAKQKWTKRCPMCKIHRDIHREMRRVYRFR